MNTDDYLRTPVGHEGVTRRIFNEADELVIFDVGSCEGEDSIRYKRSYPNATIYAFEPLKSNLVKINDNLLHYGASGIKVVPLALSNKVGSSVFHVSSGAPNEMKETDTWDYGNKSSSLLAPKEVKKKVPWLKFEETVEVSTTTLKEFCKKKDISAIDLIHMDVQGAEKMVLEGAGELISGVRCIWLEVEKVELYENQALEGDIEAFLKAAGFTKMIDHERDYDGDQLYVRNDVAQALGVGLVGRLKRKVRRDLLGRAKSKPSHKKTSFSQSGEDLIVKFIFDALGNTKPSYIDVGAHHPGYINNTALFYKLGSRGINVEPDPDLFSLFPRKRPHDINLNVGVGAKSKEADFYVMDPPTLNTFSKSEAKKYVEEHGFRIKKRVKLPVKTLSEIVEEYCDGQFPDFLSVDVEGLDYQLIKSIDFRKSRPTVICVETISYSDKGAGVKQENIITLLESKGYMVYADTNINTIFVRSDKWVRSVA